MRAITLWQPWASLMAEGIKTIETRGRAHPWRSAIGETIAIHAAVRAPDHGLELGRWLTTRRPDVTLPDGQEFPGRWLTADLDSKDTIIPLVFGAVLATGRLADVVPIVDDGTARNCIDRRAGGERLTLRRDDETIGIPEEIIDVSAELPYGTFEPGRWALLFENVVKLNEPCSAVGHQGLWTVPPGAIYQTK